MEHTERTVRLNELLAVIIKGGRLVIIVALVAAILMGSYGALWYYVLAEDPDEEYRILLEDYELQKHNLQTAIERDNKNIENQQEYIDKSLLMKIDPYNKYTTSITFAISGIDTGAIKDSFSALETPVSYMTSRIQTQYIALWNSVNLEELVTDEQYKGSADKYLREVIRFWTSDGGLMHLSVVGGSQEQCERIAKSLCDHIMEYKTHIDEAAYSHNLVTLSDMNTMVQVDLELEQQQLDNLERVEKYRQNVVECQKELLELKQPGNDGGLKGIVSNAVIGGIGGVVLACVWLVGSQLCSNKITGTKEMLVRFPLVYLGTVAEKRSLWTKMAAFVVGERVWKEKETALDYIRENAVTHIPEGSSVVVVSTVESVNAQASQKLVQALSARGCQVCHVTDIAHNPEALAAIRQGTRVVLAEQAFETKRANVETALTLIAGIDKPVFGFVML